MALFHILYSVFGWGGVGSGRGMNGQIRIAVHAARCELGAMEDFGTLRLLQGRHVRPDGR